MYCVNIYWTWRITDWALLMLEKHRPLIRVSCNTTTAEYSTSIEALCEFLSLNTSKIFTRGCTVMSICTLCTCIYKNKPCMKPCLRSWLNSGFASMAILNQYSLLLQSPSTAVGHLVRLGVYSLSLQSLSTAVGHLVRLGV